MYNRLRGLATPERSSLSLSLSLFSRACIRVPPLLYPFIFPTPCLDRVPWVWQYLFYFSCTLLGHTLGTLAMSVSFPALCDSIEHDVCIYMPAYVWVIVHFVRWTLVATWVTLSSHDSFWPCSVDMCLRQLPLVHIHAILCVWSLRCDCFDPCHQVTLVSLCMRHASTCLIFWKVLALQSTSMSMRTIYTDAKPC